MKFGMKTLCVIQYKLRMMDIPISGASYIYRDNMSVIYDTSKPEPTLKKKCNSIAHHAICKSLAMEKTLTWHIRSKDSPSALLTKVITGHKCRHLVSLVSYDIYY